MQYKRLHCWDCGQQLLTQRGPQYTTTPALREVKFWLSDGSYTTAIFCANCAAKPWPVERMAELTRAIRVEMPELASHITGVDSVAPVMDRIVGVMA